MAPRTEANRHGLRLTLPGAPNTPHTVAGLRGYFWPSFATPVGEPGELPIEAARAADRQEGLHLELVEITAAQAQQAKAAIDQHRASSGRYLAEAVRAGGAEAEIARDELAMNQAAGAAAEKED